MWGCRLKEKGEPGKQEEMDQYLGSEKNLDAIRTGVAWKIYKEYTCASITFANG